MALSAGVCGNRTSGLYASSKGRRDIWVFVEVFVGLNRTAFGGSAQGHVLHPVSQFQNAVTHRSFRAGLSLCFLEYL